MEFEDIGLCVPKILLPNKSVDLTKWSVIACDQYNTQKEYWEKVKGFVGGSPSTLHLIFPEAYLDSGEYGAIVDSINRNMREYVDEGVLDEGRECFILVERTLPSGKKRRGLIVALDLEKYDYDKDSKTLIRTTEGVYLSKLDTRIKIREKATIELPHILVLIDDNKKEIIEPLFKKKLEKLFDFKLMMNGGHIRGYAVGDEHLIMDVVGKLRRMADPDEFKRKYGVGGSENIILYLMGDGNHSFAAARKRWDRIKKGAEDQQAVMNHPARYAMVELINIHDEGLSIEAIHRLAFNVDFNDMVDDMRVFYEGQGSGFSVERFDSEEEMFERLEILGKDGLHNIPFVHSDGYGIFSVGNPKHNFETETLEAFLVGYTDSRSGSAMEFVHGEDVLRSMGSREGNVGFYMPRYSKKSLFKSVLLHGAFPRKSVSMGHADEKKYYLECRKIV
ncbi:MAG: DUF1015 domain-containing protein [Candidatus Altiarchaeota archaeon]